MLDRPLVIFPFLVVIVFLSVPCLVLLGRALTTWELLSSGCVSSALLSVCLCLSLVVYCLSLG